MQYYIRSAIIQKLISLWVEELIQSTENGYIVIDFIKN